MNTFTAIFLIAIALGLLLEYWLLYRQARSVARHRDRVPDAFADKISLPQHRTAAAYTLANITHERVGLLVGSLILLGWTLAGGLDRLALSWQELPMDPLWQGSGLVLSVLLIGMTLEMPLSLWRIFGIEKKFGFNRTTPKQFVKDTLIQILLTLIIATPLLLLVLWIMDSLGGYWWLAAWAVWMAFTLFFSWAYPVLIAPLFNHFSPLQDDSLRQRLEKLLHRCGFHSKGMFVMDGSKRSAHGNAYFTGFGKNKRIVFYDTLLEGLEADQIEAVLAHELGHFKHHHVLKNMLLMGMLSLAGLALLGWLMQQPGFYSGLGVSVQTPAVALLLFMLVLPVFAPVLTPLLAALSRKHEFEADRYAVEQASAQALIDGLVRMYRDNASTLTPDALYSAFHHSHPPASIRIAHLSGNP